MLKLSKSRLDGALRKWGANKKKKRMKGPMEGRPQTRKLMRHWGKQQKSKRSIKWDEACLSYIDLK